jgi:hypothetical protein
MLTDLLIPTGMLSFQIVDWYVPNPGGAAGAEREALLGTERAMEEHEISLFAELHGRTIDRISPYGTEEERYAELVEVIKGDPEALHLYARLKLIEMYGGGSYGRRLLELREEGRALDRKAQSDLS